MGRFQLSVLAGLCILGFALTVELTAASARAAGSNNIVLIGYWNPAGKMIKSFSTNKEINPDGWIGKNWKNSGYDVYSFFPTFKNEADLVGEGDFRVDYASTYNDFLRVTQDLKPIAMIGYGSSMSDPWDVEEEYPPYFKAMFESGNIESRVNVKVPGPIPDSLKTDRTLRSSLPVEKIIQAVNAIQDFPLIAKGGTDPGNFLCGFLGYLLAWYHQEHADFRDEAYNAMAGFIHVGVPLSQAINAQEQTLWVVTHALAQLEPPLPLASTDLRQGHLKFRGSY